MATIYLRQGDNNVVRYISCLNADLTYPNLSEATLEFHAGYEGDPASKIIDKTATLYATATATVAVTFLSADTETAYEGLDAEIEARWADGTIITFPTKSGQLKLTIIGEVA